MKLAPTEGGVAVWVSIEEATTAGQLSPRLTDKYRPYFVRWVNELKAELV